MSNPTGIGNKYPIGAQFERELVERKRAEKKAEIKAGKAGQTDKLADGSIVVQLPFGFCLIRGRLLRDLQRRCRTAEYIAAVRSKRLASLIKKMIRAGIL